MKDTQIRNLEVGDVVMWSDPDHNSCSKRIVIRAIKMAGDVVQIIGQDGSYLECYPEDLR